MAKPRYYDKMGAPIQKERWDELRKDSAYAEVLSYSNGSLKAQLIWIGKVPNPELMSPEYWPIFRLDVFNVIDAGTLSERMVPAMESGETYGYIAEAKKAYQDLLLTWGGGEMVEGKKGKEFVEVDNIYAPPPPEDYDAPATTAEVGDDGVSGGW